MLYYKISILKKLYHNMTANTIPVLLQVITIQALKFIKIPRFIKNTPLKSKLLTVLILMVFSFQTAK